MTATVDTLYYDGKCSLCNAEMVKLSSAKGDSLRLVDIHTVAAECELPPRDELLRTLHLQTAQGDFVTGLEANIAAWEHTAAAGRWRLLRLPLVHQLAQLGYVAWARWRYWRLYRGQSL